MTTARHRSFRCACDARRDHIRDTTANDDAASGIDIEKGSEPDRDLGKTTNMASQEAHVIDIPAAHMKSTVGSSESRPLTVGRSRTSQRVEALGNRKNEYGKYLYAIIPYDGEKRFGHIGIDDEEVYTIAYQDIACVVQDTSVEEYELSEGNVRRHDEVLRHLLGSYAVLPAEFGTVFQNARILAQLVRKAYVLLKESLELVDNSVELGVKVIRRRDPEDIEAEQGKPNSVEILENLRKNAVKSASGDLFSDRLILNESFLVKKEAVGSFSEDVARFGSNYPTLRILYSGPWAPYNFVYVKVGKEGIELRKKR